MARSSAPAPPGRSPRVRAQPDRTVRRRHRRVARPRPCAATRSTPRRRAPNLCMGPVATKVPVSSEAKWRLSSEGPRAQGDILGDAALGRPEPRRAGDPSFGRLAGHLPPHGPAHARRGSHSGLWGRPAWWSRRGPGPRPPACARQSVCACVPSGGTPTGRGAASASSRRGAIGAPLRAVLHHHCDVWCAETSPVVALPDPFGCWGCHAGPVENAPPATAGRSQ